MLDNGHMQVNKLSIEKTVLFCFYIQDYYYWKKFFMN